MIETFYGKVNVLAEKEINGQTVAACVGIDRDYREIVAFLTINGAMLRESALPFEDGNAAHNYAHQLLSEYGAQNV